MVKIFALGTYMYLSVWEGLLNAYISEVMQLPLSPKTKILGFAADLVVI